MVDLVGPDPEVYSVDSALGKTLGKRPVAKAFSILPGLLPLAKCNISCSEKKKYEDREEMIKWANCQAIEAGFELIIDKSYSDSGRKKKLKLVLACERSGEYKGTKKCKREGIGLHNHKMEPKLEGHMLAGRLTAKDSKIVGDMTRNLIKPKKIMLDLKGRRRDNMTVAKQIYNACQRYKLSI
ncbi:uncharacterized protein [Medicago truncatula]|uniref:FAR1 DNA-binding domain protein n=1 Tax=Medicago truncatula TaxID=3880 RepID=A0A072V7Q5_MEDTR|nr:uncharacterized protein LOC25488385 [Medicago truncatula]KEH38089.1 hypothetical protein MTR_2g461140 [Medicago truncatula]